MNLLDALKGRLSLRKPVEDRDEDADRVRGRWSGQIAPLPTTQTRWHMSDLERAIQEADVGDISRAAVLCRSMRRDGVLAGVLSTRAGGMVRLPRKFRGHPEIVAALQGTGGGTGLFDTVFPAAELRLLAEDGILLGIGVAELLPVEGAPFKVLKRLDPQWLRYRWDLDRWYYNSLAGPLPIEEGDGRWILHRPGGGTTPWAYGLWLACGRAWINKEHAMLMRSNYEGKLANPARFAKAPAGASEPQRKGFIKNLIAWGINTVFELPPGWEVGLLESNGRGYEVFSQTIATSDQENIVAIAGQTVTTDGGAGFVNGDLFKSIRADLIEDTAKGLEHTLNTQAIPVFANDMFGAAALDEPCTVHYDTTPPKDRKVQADAQRTAAEVAKSWNELLRPAGQEVDLEKFAIDHSVPVKDREDALAQLADAVLAKVGELAAAPVALDTPPAPRALARAVQPAPFATTYQGIEVYVDRPRGYVQTGETASGQAWERVYFCDYGYLPGTQGGDLEPLDVFLGPVEDAETAYLITQVTAAGEFDELKLMFGFAAPEHAKAMYLRHVPPQYLGSISSMPMSAVKALLGMEPVTEAA